MPDTFSQTTAATMIAIMALLVTNDECRAETRVDVTRDRMGNVYPPECRRDLAADTSLNILRIRADLGTDYGGVTHPELVGGRAMVLIAKNPQPYRGMTASEVDADNLQHEICHALLLLQGKNPRWHR